MSSSSARSGSGQSRTDSAKLLAGPNAEKDKSSGELEWVDNIPLCPVYLPSMEEFQDPLAFIQAISKKASEFGICKIVSPWQASVPASVVLTKEKKGFEFATYVQPLRLQQWTQNDEGTFLLRTSKRKYKSFEKMANNEYAKRFPNQDPTTLPPTYIEKEYWRAMACGFGEVEYAANVDGTAFSSQSDDQLAQSNANLMTLPMLPLCPLRWLDYKIAGVSVPMLYIGMIFGTFAWHVEDHFLYSINYNHSGAPKTWYGVPGAEASKLENLALNHVYNPEVLSPVGADGAAAKLSEKTTMFPPSLLRENEVRVYKAVQMPGEYVVTFPRAYHAGFSQGFNVGEAVNFALDDWFLFGATAGDEYAKIGKLGNLPYEELLCKEAIHLSNSLKDQSPSAELVDKCPVMMSSFVRHFEDLANAVLQLNSFEAKFLYSQNSQGTIVCHLCKRDCYLIFLECERCGGDICLFHEFKSLNCLLDDPNDDESVETEVKKSEVDSPKHKCQGQVVVFVREDIRDVINAHKKFRQGNTSPSLEQVLVRLGKNKSQASVQSGKESATPETREGIGKAESFKPCPADSKKPRSKRGLRNPEMLPRFG